MREIAKNIQDHWATIRPILSIRSEREYDRAVKRLNQLLDEIGSNERHPLYELMDTLGTLIHAYEEKHVLMPESTGIEILCALMEEHGLRKSDLPEIGSPRIISEVLQGRRELSVQQVRALAHRFGVSPALFI